MNKNINLTKILKNCPKDWVFYSIIYGNVYFHKINDFAVYPIIYATSSGSLCSATAEGKHYREYGGECTLFPSQEQRDWSKFSAPWYKKEKFDPKTLQPFDKVLILDTCAVWQIELFSYIRGIKTDLWYQCLNDYYSVCIPYNEETKYLVGTTEEAPEYYRYWKE